MRGFLRRLRRSLRPWMLAWGLGLAFSGAFSEAAEPPARFQDILTVATNSEGMEERPFFLALALGDQGQLLGLRTLSAGEEWFYSIEELERTVAMYTKDTGVISKDIILLTAREVQRLDSAVVTVTVLRRFSVWGNDDYRSFEMHLINDDAGNWILVHVSAASGEVAAVDGLYLETYRPSGREVGIGQVGFSWQGTALYTLSTASMPEAQ